jgi:hypothetical protein
VAVASFFFAGLSLSRKDYRRIVSSAAFRQLGAA